MKWKLPGKFKFPRRQYLRPLPPSRREKLIGVVILVIVAGIGVAIYFAGKRYDANLFRLDPNLLKKGGGDKGDVPRVEGGRGASRDGEPVKLVEPTPTPTATPTGENATPTPTPTPTNIKQDNELIPAAVAGIDWARKGDLQKFTTDNLYDKVDGRENLYKQYEFHELLAGDFVAAAAANRFIQVELFDMTTPKSAQGIFSAERPPHITSAKIGREAYTDTNGAFFWKGKFYVRVIGSDAEPSTQKAAVAIALAIAARLPESKETEAMKDPLPTENRVPNSFKNILESAFGQSFFRNVFSARYKVDGVELNGFVMATESDTKAASIIDEYAKAMDAVGKLQKIGDGAEAVYYLESYGSHYVIFSRGKFVGGVMEADAKEPAIKLAKQLAVYIGKQK